MAHLKPLFLVAFVLALLTRVAVAGADEPSYKDGEIREYNVRISDPAASWRLAPGRYVVRVVKGSLKVDDDKWGILEHTPMVYPGKEYLAAGYPKDDVENFKHQWGFPLPPVKVGLKWSSQYKGGQRDKWRNAQFEVVGMEDVSTPTGNLRAYKIKRVSDYTEDFYWYVEELHGAVRFISRRYLGSRNSVFETTVELVSYTPAP